LRDASISSEDSVTISVLPMDFLCTHKEKEAS